MHSISVLRELIDELARVVDGGGAPMGAARSVSDSPTRSASFILGEAIGAFSAGTVLILSTWVVHYATFVFYYPLVWLVPWLAGGVLVALALREPAWLVPLAAIAAPAAFLFLAADGWMRVMGVAHVGYAVAAWLMMRNEPLSTSDDGRRGAI